MKTPNKLISIVLGITLLAQLIPLRVLADEIVPPPADPAPEVVPPPEPPAPVIPDPAPEIIPPPETPVPVAPEPTPDPIPEVVPPSETPTPVSSPVISDFVRLTIRYNDTIIYSNTTTLNTAPITVTDNTGSSHTSTENTVLGLLTQVDQTSDAFAITDLAYYASFDSFLINCLSSGAISACYNWQYTVNDSYPYVGIDDYTLHSGDEVYLYFGNQTRFSLATSTVTLGSPVIVTSEKYQYRTNDWGVRTNVTAGATTPDPANPWSPIVITTALTNNLGLAELFISATGTFDIGISDDYYYPLVPVTIIEATQTTSTTTTPTSNSSTGGSSETPVTPSFNVGKAGQFLASNQKTTGAIGSASLYTDWAAIAVGSLTNSSAKNQLITYYRTNPDSGTTATDYERRAMALLALGLNPYSDTSTNYIAQILRTYQNNQFGDAGLVNDDIFAIIPLLKSGYSTADLEIKNSVAFIISKQNSNGGWESPDLTAAAVQALSMTKSLPGVTEALNRAKNYLKLSTKADGRIGDNAFSTSWGIQAINSLGESVTGWNANNPSPLAYLTSKQNSDGGLEDTTTDLDSRVWSTSYAIPAAQNKTWDTILSSVNKPNVIVPLVSSPETVVTATSTIATTTTPILTTTTPEILVPILELPATTTANVFATPTETIEPIETILAITNTPEITSRQHATQLTLSNTTTELPTAEIIEPTSTPESPEAVEARRLLTSGLTVAGSAGAYLAWRLLQAALV